MWCSKCRDDVIVVASSDDSSALACIDCKQVVFIDSPSTGASIPFLKSDAWVARPRSHTVAIDESFHRFDRSHSTRLVTEPVENEKTENVEPRRQPNPATTNHASFLVWCVLTIGLASLTCGVVLVSWSMLNNLNESWRIGIPAALVGLVLFLVGMVLQLDILSFYSQKTINVLNSRESNQQQRKAPNSPRKPNAIMHDLQNRLDDFIAKVPYET